MQLVTAAFAGLVSAALGTAAGVVFASNWGEDPLTASIIGGVLGSLVGWTVVRTTRSYARASRRSTPPG